MDTDNEVIKNLVTELLLLNKSPAYISKRLGLPVSEIELYRNSNEFRDKLERQHNKLLLGVENSISLFQKTVDILFSNLDKMDNRLRKEVLELLVGKCGFGKLISDNISSNGSELSISKEERLRDLGIGIGGSININTGDTDEQK